MWQSRNLFALVHVPFHIGWPSPQSFLGAFLALRLSGVGPPSKTTEGKRHPTMSSRDGKNSWGGAGESFFGKWSRALCCALQHVIH